MKTTRTAMSTGWLTWSGKRSSFMMFRHPKYYAELRKQGRKLTSSQASKLSNQPTEGPSPQAKGSSLTPKSTSSKILEPGYKRTS